MKITEGISLTTREHYSLSSVRLSCVCLRFLCAIGLRIRNILKNDLVNGEDYESNFTYHLRAIQSVSSPTF